MSNMFYNCKSLLSLDLSDFNTQNIDYMFSMGSLLSNCNSLLSLNLPNFYIYIYDSIFSDCNSLINKYKKAYISINFN